MKSYYSIMLFILFAGAMAIMAVVYTIINKQDLSPADAAIVALAVLAAMLAYRLSQAEKRIASLEEQVENEHDDKKISDQKHAKELKDAVEKQLDALDDEKSAEEKETTKL